MDDLYSGTMNGRDGNTLKNHSQDERTSSGPRNLVPDPSALLRTPIALGPHIHVSEFDKDPP